MSAGAWVYRQTETAREEPPSGLFTVGFYEPTGKWHPESDWQSADAAAARVHWLNGGTLDRYEAACESCHAVRTLHPVHVQGFDVRLCDDCADEVRAEQESRGAQP